MILYFGTLTVIADLTACIFASCIIAVIYIECGTGYALTAYAATAFISFLIVPDKSGVLLYIFFSGYYPIIKPRLEQNSFVESWMYKIMYFYFVCVFLQLVLEGLLEVEAEYVLAVFLVIGTLAFILVDILIGRFGALYIYKIRPKLVKRGFDM